MGCTKGQGRIPEGEAPKFTSGRSTAAVIDAEIGKDAKGVLFAIGGISRGFTVYMDKGFLKAEYNAMTLDPCKAASQSAIPIGNIHIRYIE
jgi:arylsulfatase